MQLLSWLDWLDKYIPYYEAEKQRSRFLDNPPESILIIYPYDDLRHRSQELRTARHFEEWDTLAASIFDSHSFRAVPLFLSSDTKQEWIWAFWSRDEALMAVLCLN